MTKPPTSAEIETRLALAAQTDGLFLGVGADPRLIQFFHAAPADIRALLDREKKLQEVLKAAKRGSCWCEAGIGRPGCSCSCAGIFAALEEENGTST